MIKKLLQEIKSCRLPVPKGMSQGDEIYNMGNIVSNSVVILYHSTWELVLLLDHFVLYCDMEPLLCTAESIRMYVNCSSVNKQKRTWSDEPLHKCLMILHGCDHSLFMGDAMN